MTSDESLAGLVRAEMALHSSTDQKMRLDTAIVDYEASSVLSFRTSAGGNRLFTDDCLRLRYEKKTAGRHHPLILICLCGVHLPVRRIIGDIHIPVQYAYVSQATAVGQVDPA